MTTSARARRRPWADLRFLIGIALVIASVVGVWSVVAAAQQTRPVLQATRTIVPGEPLDPDALRVVDVALGAWGDGYLAPTSLSAGLVAARTVEAGELVPSSAAEPPDAGRTTSILVSSTTGVPENVRPGTVVEVWSAPPRTEGRGFTEPRVLIPTATVAAVDRDGGLLGDSASSLELVIDRSEVGGVLAALASGAALSAVPTRAAR